MYTTEEVVKMFIGLVVICALTFGLFKVINRSNTDIIKLRKFTSECNKNGGYVSSAIPDGVFTATYQCIKNGSLIQL